MSEQMTAAEQEADDEADDFAIVRAAVLYNLRELAPNSLLETSEWRALNRIEMRAKAAASSQTEPPFQVEYEGYMVNGKGAPVPAEGLMAGKMASEPEGTGAGHDELLAELKRYRAKEAAEVAFLRRPPADIHESQQLRYFAQVRAQIEKELAKEQ